MRQTKGTRWFTCIFEDGTIVQKRVPTSAGVDVAQKIAKSEWRFINALRTMREKYDKDFHVKPQAYPNPEYDRKFQRYIEIVKGMKDPVIRLFQWEGKVK